MVGHYWPKKFRLYNNAEMDHTLYSDWSTCTVFETPKPKLMQRIDEKLTTLAIKYCTLYGVDYVFSG